MARLCYCGQPILPDRGICQECGEIYGYNRTEWPAWLRFWVNDNNREEMCCSRHEEVPLSEIEPNGRGGYRAKSDFNLRGCRTETHLHKDRNAH